MARYTRAFAHIGRNKAAAYRQRRRAGKGQQMDTTETLSHYLADRPWHELRRLQRRLNCRIYGSARKNADLRVAILTHAAHYGLTRDQAAHLLKETL